MQTSSSRAAGAPLPPDVGAAFPGSGDAQGFNTTITGLSPGVHTLWAYAINAAGGGAYPLLRTLQVTVSG
jgi:hypothetical protein